MKQKTYIDSVRITGKYEKHNKRYDGKYYDHDSSKKAAVSVGAVYGEMVQSRLTSLRSSHPEHASWKKNLKIREDKTYYVLNNNTLSIYFN